MGQIERDRTAAFLRRNMPSGNRRLWLASREGASTMAQLLEELAAEFPGEDLEGALLELSDVLKQRLYSQDEWGTEQ